MKTPYEILAVTEDSADSEIKKAYLVKVREYPPERFPELFQQIRQAYELIRSEEQRFSYSLFYTRLPEPVDIAEIILSKQSKLTVPTKTTLKKQLSQDIQKFCTELEI